MFEVKTVNFEGAEIQVAKDTTTEKLYVGISWICKGIGFSKSQKDYQIAIIQNDFTLSGGCLLLQAGVLDEHNQVLTLELDYLPLWLAKLTITKKIQEETPEMADRILQFQLKAKDVLASAFINKQEMVPMTISEFAVYSANKMLEQEREIKNIKLNQNQLTSRVDSIEAESKRLRSHSDYYTIVAFCNIVKFKVSLVTSSQIGKECTKYCRTNNLKIDKTHDVRFGTVNVYPVDVLVLICNQLFPNHNFDVVYI